MNPHYHLSIPDNGPDTFVIQGAMTLLVVLNSRTITAFWKNWPSEPEFVARLEFAEVQCLAASIYMWSTH